MKLYRVTGPGKKPVWTGTQADAAAIKARYKDEGAKRNEVGAEAVDIPTDKAGLLEWLNKEAAKA